MDFHSIQWACDQAFNKRDRRSGYQLSKFRILTDRLSHVRFLKLGKANKQRVLVAVPGDQACKIRQGTSVEPARNSFGADDVFDNGDLVFEPGLGLPLHAQSIDWVLNREANNDASHPDGRTTENKLSLF
jgi:hypothetical protein